MVQQLGTITVKATSTVSGAIWFIVSETVYPLCHWCSSWIGFEIIPERHRVDSGVTGKVGLTIHTIFREREKLGTTTTRSDGSYGPRTNRAPTCESGAGAYKFDEVGTD